MNLEKTLQKLGIEALNAMQEEAIDAILRGRKDVVLLSPTGTGKTLAYLLPLAQLLDADSEHAQALVIVPGRELALQSDTVLKSMGSGLRSMACYGGRTAMDEHRKMREVKPQIIFGTPGRINDHLDKGNISTYSIRYLVIDEFDKCLEMGFHDEMSRLLKKLPGLERRILLSATEGAIDHGPLTMDHSWKCINFLHENPPSSMVNGQSSMVNERVTLYEVKSPVKDKLDTLRQLLCQLGDAQSIVFLNYRDAVERVAEYLRKQGFGVSAFHGGMEQKQREDALYKFSNGSANVLVATDLASRGLDIPDIQNIIHYHLPVKEQEMIHRVGRTARWDKMGQSYFIVGPEETMPEWVIGGGTKVEGGGRIDSAAELFSFQLSPSALPQQPALPKMATIYIGKGKKDKISKGDILGFLCKKGELEMKDIGRIDVTDRYAYAAVSREKLQQVLRLVKGEKIKGIRTVIEPVK